MTRWLVINCSCSAALVLTLGPLGAPGFAADNFHKLKDAEIRSRLAGMETTDGVHWVEQYMRDGTYTAVHMGKSSKGKWFVRDDELCLDAGKGGPDCREVWISGNKIEFRGTGFQGLLQPQRKRG